MAYIFILVGAIMVLYGIQGMKNRRISWRTDANQFDKLTGRAGLFDTHVENDFEGPMAVVMGAVIAGAGGFLAIYAISQIW